MIGWILTPTEANRLMYLPHAAIVMYVMVFRRHMCFRTGVVGDTYRISERALCERLEVNRPPGSREPDYKPTRQQVRTMIKQLETAGLLTRIPDKPMVFKLPLASTGLIRPNEQQPEEQPKQQPAEQPKQQPKQQPNENSANQGNIRPFPNKKAEHQPEEQPEEQPQEQPDQQPEEQPTSDVYSDLLLQGDDLDEFREPFLMDLSWKPSKGIVANLKMAGVVDYNPLILTEFVHHWTDPDNNQRLNQHQWENKFLNRVITCTRTPAMRQNTSARYKAAAKGKKRETAAQRFQNQCEQSDSQMFSDPGGDSIPGEYQEIDP